MSSYPSSSPFLVKTIMTEFKKLQELAKLKNEDTANLFKVSERTISRWRTNEVEAPESALIVLRSMVKP